MKIIFSRKGFDASNGGVPSPILPDGQMVSLPIPSSQDVRRMGNLVFDGINLGHLTEQLTNGQVDASRFVHLDPDINAMLVPRAANWRPAFGQTGAAQRHLANQMVGVGDLFLFYGWFRQTEVVGGRHRYVRAAPGIHAIFGWLQIGEKWAIAARRDELLAAHPAQANHPHLASLEKYANARNKLNTLYVASPRLALDSNRVSTISGGGTFLHYRESLRLSKPGSTRRHWRLPLWMMPGGGRPPLSYHRSPAAWALHDDHVELRTACIGQEFVLDCAHYPEAIDWAGSLYPSSS